jgi:hypothetical protein
MSEHADGELLHQSQPDSFVRNFLILFLLPTLGVFFSSFPLLVSSRFYLPVFQAVPFQAEIFPVFIFASVISVLLKGTFGAIPVSIAVRDYLRGSIRTLAPFLVGLVIGIFGTALWVTLYLLVWFQWDFHLSAGLN